MCVNTTSKRLFRFRSVAKRPTASQTAVRRGVQEPQPAAAKASAKATKATKATKAGKGKEKGETTAAVSQPRKVATKRKAVPAAPAAKSTAAKSAAAKSAAAKSKPPKARVAAARVAEPPKKGRGKVRVAVAAAPKATSVSTKRKLTAVDHTAKPKSKRSKLT